MAYKKQPRLITDQQFSDSTTIDGNRIDCALSDTVERFNDIPLGDIKKRFVQCQMVQGWTPQQAVFFSLGPIDKVPFHHFPWMDIYNHWNGQAESNSMVVTTDAEPNFQNDFRVKGTDIPGIDHTAKLSFDDHPQGRQYAWTTTMYFSEPAVLRNLSLMMLTDTVHETALSSQNFTYDANDPPQGQTAGNPSKDIVVAISIDNPFNPEDQQFNSQVFARNGFIAARENVSLNALPVSGFTDMVPAAFAASASGAASISPKGFWMEYDMNIPIPRDSRVRMSIIIPRYDLVVVGPGSWGDSTGAIPFSDPWYRQSPHSTLSWLEEVQ